jgi:hypothetical protein
MPENLQKLSVRVSYSIQEFENLSAEILALAAEYDGTFNELTLESASELVITLTFINSYQLIEFVNNCKKKYQIKIISIERDEENYRKINFLKKIIGKRINSFKDRRSENRKQAIRLKFVSLIVASSTTILLGLNGFNTQGKLIVQNTAFILSAITAFLTAVDTFFNYRGLWIRYNATLNELYELRDNLEYLCTDEATNISKEDVDKLYQKYQTILNETNNSWKELRKEQNSPQNS